MSQQKHATSTHIEVDWKTLADSTGPYPIEAFFFVRDGLTWSAHRIHESMEHLAEHERHITGQQLCLGLRDFAIERYGMLAPAVLHHWHVHRTEDFGRIVFAMVQQGLLSKTSEDTIDDFRCVYDFHEAFSPDQVAARICSN